MGSWKTAQALKPDVFLPHPDISFDIRELLQQLTTVHSNGLSEPIVRHKSWREAVSSLYRTVSLQVWE